MRTSARCRAGPWLGRAGVGLLAVCAAMAIGGPAAAQKKTVRSVPIGSLKIVDPI